VGRPVALVTRAVEDAAPLVAALQANGFDVVQVPCVARRPLVGAWPAALEQHGHAAWLLLTSPATAEIVAAGPPLPASLRVAAVGPTTAGVARRGGLTVHRVAETSTGQALVACLGGLTGLTVLYPGARTLTASTLTALRDAGALVQTVTVYDNVVPEGLAEALRRVLPVDVVTLLSASAARRFADATPPSLHPPAVVIGPSTEAAARSAGLQIVGVASPHTVTALARTAGLLVDVERT
jgi:uroporphyrinogen-III synthase